MQKTDNRERLKYVRWLLNKMGAAEVESLSLYLALLDIDFYWTDDFKEDGNRAADARALRDDYIYDTGSHPGVSTAPTVLEVLVAMAERATPIGYDPAWTWFQNFLTNLGFDYLTDALWSDDAERFVKSTVRKWLDRRFSPSGVGSPFRGNGTYDVSKVSMWSSLQWYLADTYGEGHI